MRVGTQAALPPPRQEAPPWPEQEAPPLPGRKSRPGGSPLAESVVDHLSHDGAVDHGRVVDNAAGSVLPHDELRAGSPAPSPDQSINPSGAAQEVPPRRPINQSIH